MKSVILSSVLPLTVAVAVPLGMAGKAFAAEPDKQFFHSVEGKWVGPGEIVAGKYKGTKFTCNFNGSTPDGKIGMTLDGDCRVGMFTQKMSATVEHKGRDGYKGNFMGGASGSGLDIIGGNVIDNRKVVFTINRKQLRGVMQARIPDDNSMTVTVAVRVDQQLVPVIGMSLKRVDAVEVGSIAPN
ncbi:MULTISPECIES: hypothetical protein [unclassified Mesorhizobium]|uniref:hypothetical protein n=1 Tax=unclassified Mesorhizobium TaxID=325217 RepID=UPI000FDA3090|nr:MULTISPECIES: hypothetical protein [unclassified Mesorhizobium]TGQ47923.1 hypothetical protein EN859_001750 [Mesorhizobium sp. M00.F.Ca.ET.216.01.1.1]TIS54984.1 MAG: hypothetical protein E5W91_24660 [Mesorhizobium sp.]TIS92035.1 MAG: hypothetical protein E5W89_04060 [Mesorhizobium sp.]TJW17806.1 MAG: hypothetical protein E5W82_02145 [Mesorhizobium sp.]TJW42604.1 MAG: hypothetical protein E5W83_20540 [Mesorhizobium sp.]